MATTWCDYVDGVSAAALGDGNFAVAMTANGRRWQQHSGADSGAAAALGDGRNLATLMALVRQHCEMAMT
jgi:hypothetical protein